MKRRSFVVSTVFLTGGFTFFERLFAPRAELLDAHWTTLASEPGPAVDDGPWAAFLERFAAMGPDGVVRVDYGRIDAAARADLEAYLRSLQAVQPTALARKQALAYWINLYNAQTVAFVADHYPVASIRDIKPGGGLGSGPWDTSAVTVEGRALSLNDIEHGIIRPVFEDARIHYAVNCAAIGCPNLRLEPWSAATLDEDLDAAAAAYVNDSRGVAVLDDGGLILSSIYNWFAVDFGGSPDALIAHLRDHAEPGLGASLDGSPRIEDYRYDWALNDRPS